MIRLFGERPEAAPVAVGEAGERSAADLREDAGAVARYLEGARPGNVLLVCDDRYLFAASLLGTWQAGRVVVLPPNGQPGTVEAIADATGVAVFLHDRAAAPIGLDVRSLLGLPHQPEFPPPDLPPERHLVILTTSGTTGRHLTCPKTAGQLLGEVDELARAFAIDRGSRVLATVPPHHIYGLLFSVLLPLRVGGSLVRDCPLQPEAVFGALSRWGATILVSAPPHLRALEVSDGAPPLRRVFSSGAPLPVRSSVLLRERLGWRVTEVYGSTETGGIAWRDDPAAPWAPFSGVYVGAGEDGRLLLDSPRLGADVPRPLKCDDRVKLRGNGTFDLLGRSDGVAKVGAKRISVAELEERVLSLPGVRDAVALLQGVPGPRGQELALAVVAPGWSAERMRRELAAWFDPVTVPRRILFLDALPREASGKLPRDRIAAFFQADGGATIGPPLLRTAELAAVEGDGGETHSLTFVIPPDLACFEGHFDGHPVLPGVFQLEVLVRRQVQGLWPDLRFPRKVLRLKFLRIISPMTRVTVRLVRRGDEPRASFEISSPAGPCSSGVLVYDRA